ncbi:hypothetical protein K493DRAFT_247355 [Basidiobolus meristosporus CBS 931.73]|uniref:Vacuolar protein sorting-associated protein 16 homolog n=1 Tax=Basidiobolus meristosporus CBS 931.73 TaxID=1314790 RepID=A0A1Y1WPA9_9FUNG|nr:hypothetical protein K493DRAFT_247355 [Basidiobolus meristosporus CBS 931.73]|eukprot:ORX75377.1 hypothetical protein K493DRAFT_247355 [Basidiobolus meristosporus CBS 931.73]
MTGDFQLIVVSNFDEPRPRTLADPGLNEPPHSWAIIPPSYTLSRHVEVLLATGTTILVVDATDAQDQRLQQGPFTRMGVSPNGKLLALYNADGRLWVVSSDFQKSLSDFATQSKVPPVQVVWCGTDAVTLRWENAIWLVGPFGDCLKYIYDENAYLISEMDGVRIVTGDTCEFLHKVPRATEEVFKIGSTSPAAMLFDALEHFEKRSPKADENVRSIKSELTEAVDTCVEAAGHELSEHYQKALLRAASFGKCFLDSYNSDYLVNMCQSLRILNAVRYYEIGIPITYTQYSNLGSDALVNRLINQQHHLLALRICEYLKMRTDHVLVHWACSKIKQSNEDEEATCRIIIDKLKNKPGLSYAEIAKTAYKVGQPKLATKLLDYEPRAADQVPLLMSMQEDQLALIKAIESGDTDLVYLVLLNLKRKLPSGEFFRIINDKPFACNLLEVYAKTIQDKDLLTDFYYQDDRHRELADFNLLQSYQIEASENTFHTMSPRIGGTNQGDNLENRINAIKLTSKKYQNDKDHGLEVKMLDDNIRLLQAQESLESKTNEKFVGLSVSETIYKCILTNNGSRATKLKSEFRVPDNRYWWIRLRALVEIRDWEELEKFAKSKKSPIGYLPGVRPRLFLRIGSFKEAGEQAFANKDIDTLREIRTKCNNAAIARELDILLAQSNRK